MMSTDQDGRYTVGLEWTGFPTRRWVARFCGQWIGHADSGEDARRLADEYHDRRMAYTARQS